MRISDWSSDVCSSDLRFPLVLNTGSIRDQWHTMTRTAKTPRLMAHITEPFVELHPDDAATCGIAPGGLAVVESAHGRVIVRAEVTLAQRPGRVFVPRSEEHTSEIQSPMRNS